MRRDGRAAIPFSKAGGGRGRDAIKAACRTKFSLWEGAPRIRRDKRENKKGKEKNYSVKSKAPFCREGCITVKNRERETPTTEPLRSGGEKRTERRKLGRLSRFSSG